MAPKPYLQFISYLSLCKALDCLYKLKQDCPNKLPPPPTQTHTDGMGFLLEGLQMFEINAGLRILSLKRLAIAAYVKLSIQT